MSSRLLPILLILLFLSPASAQNLIYSVRADLPGMSVPVADEELLMLLPGGGSRVVLPLEALHVLVGDVDGNGLLDDGPADIDACHVAGAHGGSDWLLSTTTTMNLPDGTAVLDGDVFRFNENGAVEVVYSEGFFAGIAATSGVDVDALAVAPNGDIFFSFAEDETTTASSLIAENGGNPVLDEQVVLRFTPGETFAHVHFTKSQVTSFFSQALGGNFSTVVDVTGITCDPAGAAGDLLLVCGSSSQALMGRVVSSRNGGVVVSTGGVPIEANTFALGGPPSLDALSISQGEIQVLRALPASGSSATGGAGTLLIDGLSPGDTVKVVATAPILPGPQAIPAIAPGGFGSIHPDPAHPMWALSLASPVMTLGADASGTANLAFDYLGLQPGLVAVVQAVRLPDLVVTNPVAVNVLP